MTVSAQDVKQLRDKTGVGMMACRKALEESAGDLEKAIEILRKRGEMKASDKSDREAGEGLVAFANRTMIKVNCETDFVARNEDFVAFVNDVASKEDGAQAFFDENRTDKMQEVGENLILGAISNLEGGSVVGGYVHSNGKMGALIALDGGTEEQARDVAMHVTAMNPSVMNPEDMPQDEMDKERALAVEALIKEGKPENIIDKIVEGKMNKFAAERALTSQAFVKDGGMTVQEYLGDAKVVGMIREAV